MKTRVTLLAVGLVSLAACEGNPLGEADPAQLVASIEGGITASYEGTGEFSTAPGGLPRPIKFSLRSAGRGTASNQGFHFHSESMPSVGVYALGASKSADGEQPVHAVYSWQDGRKVERFSAREGELVITEASANRVAGTFRFTGLLTSVCTATNSSAQFCTVSPPDASSKQIVAAGSFEAVPARRLR